MVVWRCIPSTSTSTSILLPSACLPFSQCRRVVSVSIIVLLVVLLLLVILLLLLLLVLVVRVVVVHGR